jgi:hypothetical protein
VVTAALSIYVVRTRDPLLKAYRIGMTFAEIEPLLQKPYELLHPTRPVGPSIADLPKEEMEVAFLVTTTKGSSLYFDHSDRLIAVYTRAWYHPLPLRGWLGLGPPRPVAGLDIYRHKAGR